MSSFEKNTKPFVLNYKSNIKNAIKLIQNNKERVCFVVDKKNQVIGSISDGDIRRAILKGHNINDKIVKVFNKNFIFLKKNFDLSEAYKKFNKKVRIIPIVNEQMKINGILRKHDLVPFLDIKSKTILVVGLGYVGLTLSLVLADSGFEVSGYDKNTKTVKKIKNKIPPFYEKGMERYLSKNVGRNLNIFNKPKESDVYIITVGTPLKKNKSLNPDLSYLKKSLVEVSNLLKKNDLIILRSTIPVGCTRKFVIPFLEKKTGLKFGKDLFISFCPERTIEGNAIEELKKLPQIMGSFCRKSAELTKRLFSEYNFTIVEVRDLESAELAKLIDNSFRDTIFAYSNSIAMLGEKLNLDISQIIDKVNLGYSRNQIPKPSPGVGGPCLSKDPYILSDSFNKAKIENSNLIIHSRKVNELVIDNILNRSVKIFKKLKKNKNSKIFISGFAFKGFPETSDIRSSTTKIFYEKLKNKGFKNIWIHDFKVSKEDLKLIGAKSCSIISGFKKADAIFIMNNHKKYEDLNIFKLLGQTKKPVFFYDSWQIFNPYEIKNLPGVIYASVGF